VALCFAMNVTDISPVHTDEPGYELALECLFILVALFCFIRVSTYAVQQARMGTLVNSPRSPLVFPIHPALACFFIFSVLALILSRSDISPLYYVFVPAGIWVFLTGAKRSGEYQFGLSRLGLFHLARWTFVICGAFFFVELPLGHVVDRLMTWLQLPHPVQNTVVVFKSLQRPDQILYFMLWAGVIAPVIEELFFRGFLYSFLKRFTSVWMAIIVSAGVFAFAHLNLDSVLQLWLLGIVLAVAYEHTGSLLLPMGIHACFNFINAVALLIEKGAS
jgi:membrane protease YdiL (CAAX protease family)